MLVARGHQVRFLGYALQRAEIEARGFGFTQLARSGGFNPVGAHSLDERLAGYIACPEHLLDIEDALDEHPADALIVDYVLNGALVFAARRTLPAAVLAHSGIGTLVPPRESPVAAACLAAINRIRDSELLSPLAHLEGAWAELPTLVATIPQLDSASANAEANVCYIGPIREKQVGLEWASPWTADDHRPLVLASFSTTGFWDQQSRMRHTLDALEGEPVRILLSCGAGGLDGPLPQNARVRPFLPHDVLLPSTSLMVSHSGNGTVTACLAHGVPMVGLPNAVDQPILAKRIEELGAGIALDGDAGPSEIRAAARQILEKPSYRKAARALALAIKDLPGATGAASALELLAAHGSQID
ncbi:MAG: glycosyltransferase [Candidatus Dormibacteria bacterium]